MSTYQDLWPPLHSVAKTVLCVVLVVGLWWATNRALLIAEIWFGLDGRIGAQR